MPAGRSSLTLSEARVAGLVAEGHTDDEIAGRLGITVVDVDAELAEVFRKLGLSSRTELAVMLTADNPPTGPSQDRRKP